MCAHTFKWYVLICIFYTDYMRLHAHHMFCIIYTIYIYIYTSRTLSQCSIGSNTWDFLPHRGMPGGRLPQNATFTSVSDHFVKRTQSWWAFAIWPCLRLVCTKATDLEWCRGMQRDLKGSWACNNTSWWLLFGFHFLFSQWAWNGFEGMLWCNFGWRCTTKCGYVMICYDMLASPMWEAGCA